MKINWKRLLICLAIPLAVGGLGALLAGGMSDYGAMAKPPLSPPGWVFPVVWSILYLLMGYASYRVVESGAPKEDIRKALTLYGLQLAANFLWSFLFFGLQTPSVALIDCAALLALSIVYMRSAAEVSKIAGVLFFPYVVWCAFATYLILYIAIFN